MTLQDDIRAEVERETRRSRYRDRTSRCRIHPIKHDVSQLMAFVIARRLRQPGVTDLLRRVLKRVDTRAVRQLVSIVLENGSYPPTMRRRCDRLLGYCATIEAALALKARTH